MGLIVILTGAGISAESGLGTFRDAGGIWARHRIEDVATPEGFAKDPERVHLFYNARRAQAFEAQPNAAHLALAALEAQRGASVLIVSQNVDSLHEKAGSKNVVHMHGRLDRALCTHCDHRWEAALHMSATDACPHCGNAETRPDVLWFGEMPYEMGRITHALSQADVFVSIGTSGNVYPAAHFVAEADQWGARTIELNLEPSSNASLFAERRIGPATEIVPAWVREELMR